MHALRLTTRFKDGAYQGEACLLVYDEQKLQGTMLSEDVRDQFNERPATARIYILAPFLSEAEVKECFDSGSLFDRVKSYFHPLGGRLFILTVSKHDGQNVAIAIPFTVDEKGDPIAEPIQSLESSLQNGWLFDLFDRHRGRLDAPAGSHFGKTSGKHSAKFLKTSSVLLTSSACAAIAYFVLTSVRTLQPRRIFVDTAPLLAVAFAIQRIAIKNKLWEMEPPIASFSSYGGIRGLPEPSSEDLILISASTSGGLVKTLADMEFNVGQIATLFFLQSTNSAETAGSVICDLTFRVGQSFGYPPIESYEAKDCPLCQKGFFLAELEGDQFQLEKRAVKRLVVKKRSQSEDARETLEILAKKNLLYVNLFDQSSSRSALSINADMMLEGKTTIRKNFIRHLQRFIPMPLHYVVMVGLKKDTLDSLIEEAALKDVFTGAKIIEFKELRKSTQILDGGALVLFGCLDNFSCARDINAQLRTIVPQGRVTYISAITFANSAEHLSDLRTFLTFGENGKDSFTYVAASNLMLPALSDVISPWEVELEMLRKLIDEGCNFPEIESRIEQLMSKSQQNESLFWPGTQGDLSIKNDFVYLDTTSGQELISQGDIFAVISNLLASVRANERGLNSQIQTGMEPIHWHQSVYGHVLLCPKNFEIYNDAVLRAAFLRAANIAELQYSSDEKSSLQIYSIIHELVLNWDKGEGDCLPEFLISLATKRLSLAAKHMAQLKATLKDSAIPPYLKIFVDRI